MKITHVTSRVLRTPADNPLVVGLPAPTDTREFVALELGTDQGLVGLALTFFGAALTPALKAAVNTLAGLVVGDDPTQSRPSPPSCGERRAARAPAGSSRWRSRPSTSRAGISRPRPWASPCARYSGARAAACRPTRAAR